MILEFSRVSVSGVKSRLNATKDEIDRSLFLPFPLQPENAKENFNLPENTPAV